MIPIVSIAFRRYLGSVLPEPYVPLRNALSESVSQWEHFPLVLSIPWKAEQSFFTLNKRSC